MGAHLILKLSDRNHVLEMARFYAEISLGVLLWQCLGNLGTECSLSPTTVICHLSVSIEGVYKVEIFR